MNEKNLQTMRHSLSHVMAQAVLNLYPNAKLAIGPAIENGFYYDFDLGEQTLSPEDLKKIEKEMKNILKKEHTFVQSELPVAEALEKLKDNPYKLEMAKELQEKGESKISFYKTLNKKDEVVFEDMCSGPHVESSKEIGAFKLDKIAGAYWRGDEKNKMLQRIYGLAFASKEELADYLKMLQEAQKRDHRKIGKELGLFSFHAEGPGFPFFHDKGMVIWDELLNYWKQEHQKDDYKFIKTPIMLSRALWEKSGHWENYRENMYTTKIDEEDYAIKPMNCPGGMLVYNDTMHSYRDLPLRMGEIGLVHRHELSGTLSGLFRVRAFHQDDAHIFMTEAQIKDEIFGVLNLVERIYKTFDLKFHLELSTRPEKSIGADEAWETATKGLQDALDAYGKEYKINEGDGAFYGPKIDVHVQDALGRTWQCATIQLDMNLPERFDLSYVDENGDKKRPVMIHRVIYGAMERFLGILIEHYAGNFPLWLSPVQVKVISVGEAHVQRIKEIAQELKVANIRVEIDENSDSVSYKIRKAEKEKIPYMLVIGDKEVESKNVTVRVKGQDEQQEMSVSDLIKEMQDKIENRK